MIDCIIIKWHDIPAQILVKIGRKSEKRKLSERFEKAIDACAMKTGTTGSEDYLAYWHKEKHKIESQEHDIEKIATEMVQKIEKQYDNQMLKELIRNGGKKIISK